MPALLEVMGLAAMAFLASARAGYINGAALTVDGGRTVIPGDFASWARAAGLDVPPVA